MKERKEQPDSFWHLKAGKAELGKTMGKVGLGLKGNQEFQYLNLFLTI